MAVYSSLKVDPSLFYLVLGESVLNDAISIVIFNVACRFINSSSLPVKEGLFGALNFLIIFSSSCLLGYLFGLLVALILRFFDNLIIITLYAVHVINIIIIIAIIKIIDLDIFLYTQLQLFVQIYACPEREEF